MMAVLFQYPEKAAFGRVVPKTKIYEHARPSATLRNQFVKQIDKIIWQYKLAPETINIPAKGGIVEIQIFLIELKTAEADADVLLCIDKAIPHPVFYELHYDGRIKMTATYKRPSDAGSHNWISESYFETPWVADNVKRVELPVALNMAGLYEQMLGTLLPIPARKDEKLKLHVDRLVQIQRKEIEVNKLKVSLRKEKQFNRKVEINTELRALQTEINKLSA